MKYLVTGAAGFIGSHVSSRLLDRGDEVVGIDNFNDYYDVNLKKARAARLENRPGFSLHVTDIADLAGLTDIAKRHSPEVIIHLAAQAGVRYSLINPHAYVQSNLVGFMNVLEVSRHYDVHHLVYASSSSVYGANTEMPFSVRQNVDHPVSLYAATKKSNELMAHSYSHLFALPTTGLRFFTVYGPWGRPDMAYFLFTKAILEGRSIDVFNYGRMARDFTYIDDIVEGVVRVADRIPAPASREHPGTSSAPYRVYNIGNRDPVPLLDMIGILERELGRPAEKNFLPLQQGDVTATFADVEELERDTGFRAKTSLSDGLGAFVQWYREYYDVRTPVHDRVTARCQPSESTSATPRPRHRAADPSPSRPRRTRSSP
jgi:UDP-glucuronate 4-epimerase